MLYTCLFIETLHPSDRHSKVNLFTKLFLRCFCKSFITKEAQDRALIWEHRRIEFGRFSNSSGNCQFHSGANSRPAEKVCFRLRFWSREGGEISIVSLCKKKVFKIKYDGNYGSVVRRRHGIGTELTFGTERTDFHLNLCSRRWFCSREIKYMELIHGHFGKLFPPPTTFLC